MKNANVRSALLAAALVTAALYSSASLAHGYDRHHGDPKPPVCKTETMSESVAGPAPYHAVYSAINATNVTLQNFSIRTEDGFVVDVPTAPLTVNLQDLSGFAKGFLLSLGTVNFPSGAPTLQVAEIRMDVVANSAGAAVSTDGSSCALSSLPKRLMFYTGAAIELGHDDYHVKVDFTALNGLEISLLTTVTQNKCCAEKRRCDDHHQDSGSQTCSVVGDPVSTTVRTCRLVNRRYPITTIPRAVDDNF